MSLPDWGCDFPVAEVGLGQMRVLRRGCREFTEHGAALQKAARLLQSRLDPAAGAGADRPARRRRRSGPLAARSDS